MKLLFTGSDVLLLNKFPKQLSKRKLSYVLFYRLVVRLAQYCIEENWVGCDHLEPELKQFGMRKQIKIFESPLYYDDKYKKKPHKGFNVLYYWHKSEDIEWSKWIYGYDIYCQIKQLLKSCRFNINFIECTGECNMSDIYPITDFYLRCNRHDGNPRIVRECKIQDIPYYWSYENPNIYQIITQIIKHATTRLDINRDKLFVE